MTGFERFLTRRRQERLRLSERLLPRIDRATEVAIGALWPAPEDDEQVVEPHDGLAGILGEDAAVDIDKTIAGGAGQYEVAGFRIDEHISYSAQAGQGEHGPIQRLMRSLAARNFSLESRKGN